MGIATRASAASNSIQPPDYCKIEHRFQNRLDGVDLLRGLAIFFVLMNHIYIRLRIAKVPFHLPDALVWNGQQGVQSSSPSRDF